MIYYKWCVYILKYDILSNCRGVNLLESITQSTQMAIKLDIWGNEVAPFPSWFCLFVSLKAVSMKIMLYGRYGPTTLFVVLPYRHFLSRPPSPPAPIVVVHSFNHFVAHWKWPAGSMEQNALCWSSASPPLTIAPGYKDGRKKSIERRNVSKCGKEVERRNGDVAKINNNMNNKYLIQFNALIKIYLHGFFFF